MILGIVAWEVIERTAMPVTTSRQVYMFWFYFLVGVAILAKGPPGLGVVGVTCLFYFVLTWNWRQLLSLEIPRGLGIGALVVVPWHVAMFLRDGRGWFSEYFNHHMFKRFGDGVHGDRGTFDYFASQIGVGMWPWVALLPIAIAATLVATRSKTRESQVRLLVGIWAVAGFSVFALSQTKFHHYVLPIIPAFGILIAFWLSDFIDKRERSGVLVALLAIGIVAFIGRDLMSEQKQLIELFIYRYDRPWPSGAPWEVDVGDTLFTFSLLFVAAFATLATPVYRRVATGVIGAVAIAFAFWVANGYMGEAAPHWGQRELHRSYYAQRTIHGLEIKYWNLRDLADEWKKPKAVHVRSVLPKAMAVGDAMRVTLHVPGAGVPDDKLILGGSVKKLGDSEFWIDIPAAERAKLADLIARGAKYKATGRRPWRQVDADRLIAWQLNWRGENFWSSGEIYGELEDTRTVFMHTDNKAFLKHLDGEGRSDRTYFVITESGRANGLRGILPSKSAKDTFKILDTSCNKFTLLRFKL